MKKIKISALGQIVTGNTPSKQNKVFYETNDIPFIKPDGLDNQRIEDLFDAKEYISNVAEDNARVLGKGSILVTCIGTIGKIGIIECDKMAFNQQINAIIPNEDIVFGRYLAYAIKYNKEQLGAIANAAVVPIINKSQFGDFSIQIHSDIKVQKEVVSILDKAQKLIDKRKEQIEACDELIKSQFIEMFGDPVLNPKSWQKHRLEEYISFLTSGSRGWSTYFRDKGEMFLTIKNVKGNKINLDNVQYIEAPHTKEAERTRVQAGDLLISITADIGRTGIVTNEIADYGAYINQHLSLVRLDKTIINPLFVSFYLESEGGKIQFDAKNQNGVKAGLNFDAIKSLEILVPALQLQNEFVQFVQKVDKLKFEMQQSLNELENNFNSLMQRSFKGELF